ncbi:MAG: NADH:ubiquinone oxidoreductase subunit NDUFA12 [Acuticoccus sp.]
MEQTPLRRLIQAFAWWTGTTWGTSFTTWLRGEPVGEDEFGNQYYRSCGGKPDPALGYERRWVIYNGEAEATKIPPGWYRWMHHLGDEVPDGSYEPREWQKPHRENRTGTPEAYHPGGSILRPDPGATARKGYDAWSPE